jgi:two-component system, LytTR family, sensor kinase
MHPRPAEGVTTRESPPWRLVAVVAIALFTIAQTLRFTYFYFGDIARGVPGTFLQRLLEEGTGGVASFVLFLGVVAFVWRAPVDRGGWKSRVPLHVGAAVVYSMAHTTLLWAMRSAVFPLAGLGPYDYGRMSARYVMEFGQDAISYASFLALITLYRYYRAMRDRELHAERLQRGLAQAQLQNLRLQLQPHFLFNALNTISSTVYEDARSADRMIGQLAELLRVSLRTSTEQEVPLGEELAMLELYLGLMRARFGERLCVRVEADPAVVSVRVPSLVLQPLVENAIRHGNVSRVGRGTVVVRAFRAGHDLRIEVENDGADPVPSTNGDGFGLRLTSERLRLLYGDASAFEAGPRHAESYVAAMRIPIRDGNG